MLDSKDLGGFTIVEILIFLAISGFLVTAAINMFGGQQDQTTFSEGAREVFSQLQAISNNVSIGYYTNTNNFSCSAAASGGAPSFSGGSNNQGQNVSCEFLGRVVQFSPIVNGTLENNQYTTYTVVGREYVAGAATQVTTSFSQALPTVLQLSGDTNATQTSNTTTLPGDLKIKSVSYQDTTYPGSPSPLVGMFSSFHNYSSGNQGALTAGSEEVNLIPLATGSCSAGLPYTPIATTTAISDVDSMNDSAANGCGSISDNQGNTPINPTGGVTVCLEGSNTEFAAITVGGNGGPLTMRLNILTAGASC